MKTNRAAGIDVIGQDGVIALRVGWDHLKKFVLFPDDQRASSVEVAAPNRVDRISGRIGDEQIVFAE
jgi:aspartyl-tRNA synthetase